MAPTETGGVDLAELKRLAKAARDDGTPFRPFTMPAYRNATEPEHILALLDRIEQLEEALRPFGAYAARIDTRHDTRGYQDACPVALVPIADPEKAIVNLGHCRRARALVSPSPSQGESNG